jgi:hypothetical protein
MGISKLGFAAGSHCPFLLPFPYRQCLSESPRSGGEPLEGYSPSIGTCLFGGNEMRFGHSTTPPLAVVGRNRGQATIITGLFLYLGKEIPPPFIFPCIGRLVPLRTASTSHRTSSASQQPTR